jgi:hypothetical protein
MVAQTSPGLEVSSMCFNSKLFSDLSGLFVQASPGS